jgi:hypothetical protein
MGDNPGDGGQNMPIVRERPRSLAPRRDTALVLFLYIVSGFVANPDWIQVVKGTFVPAE